MSSIISKRDIFEELAKTFEKINLKLSLDRNYEDIISVGYRNMESRNCFMKYSIEAGIIACGQYPNNEFLVEFLIQDFYRVYESHLRCELGI